MNRRWLAILGILCGGWALSGAGSTASTQAAQRKPASTYDASQGSQKLEFDDRVVEGMNRTNLNEADHTGEDRKRNPERLIREKTDFHDELQRSLKEIRLVR